MRGEQHDPADAAGPDDVPDAVRDDDPDAVPHDVPDAVRDDVPDDLSDDVPEQMSNVPDAPGAADDDPELAALTAAEARAREEARRAAKALKKARKARERAAAAAAAAAAQAGAGAGAAGPPPRVAVTKPGAGKAGSGTAGSRATTPGRRPTSTGTTRPAPAASAGRARRRPSRWALVTLVAAVLAAAFVGIAIGVDSGARSEYTSSPARARDAALLAARQDIVVLNTLDYRQVDQGLANWLGATTGSLRDQFGQIKDTDKQALAASKAVTTATVLAAAVTQVDPGGGNATVIASVQVVVTPDQGTPTTKRERFSATMKKVGSSWKISTLQQVGVTLS